MINMLRLYTTLTEIYSKHNSARFTMSFLERICVVTRGLPLAVLSEATLELVYCIVVPHTFSRVPQVKSTSKPEKRINLFRGNSINYMSWSASSLLHLNLSRSDVKGSLRYKLRVKEMDHETCSHNYFFYPLKNYFIYYCIVGKGDKYPHERMVLGWWSII